MSSEKTPTVNVFSSAGDTKTRAYRNSFQDRVKANRAAQITPGTATGSRIRIRVCRRLHPAGIARPWVSVGTARKKPMGGPGRKGAGEGGQVARSGHRAAGRPGRVARAGRGEGRRRGRP